MSIRDHGVTILIVTAVTLLIWFLAAGETRKTGQQFADVGFDVAGDDEWKIEPEEVGLTVHFEGAPAAVRKAEAVLKQEIELILPAEVGRHPVSFMQRLRQLEAIEATGVAIASVDPASLEIDVDQMVATDVDIVSALPPGVRISGDLVIDPPTAQVWMPSRRNEPALAVSAVLEQAVIDGLQPGLLDTVEARLSVDNLLGDPDDVRVTPETVNVTLMLQSRMAETKVGTIRVQLAGPPEDFQEFDIEVSPSTLRDVTINADEATIAEIEDETLTVVAIVHLTSEEKVDGVIRRPVTCFLIVESGAVVTSSADVAEIEVTIKSRE